MTIVMVEHELAIMDEFCDPVVVMAEGCGPGRGNDGSSCGAAARSWRPTLSAELALPGLSLRAEKVTAGYGGDPVIRDITVSADPGEVVSLVGPNGSGKSTLLKGLRRRGAPVVRHGEGRRPGPHQLSA